MSVLEDQKARQRIPEYPDWETAAQKSRWRKAISAKALRVKLTALDYQVNVLIVKPIGQDPYAVYATTVGIQIPFSKYRPTNREVDSIRWWKAF